MKIKCEYCNSMFDDTLEKCPSCGAPNQNVRRSTSDQPTTIEGLKEWYQRMGLPPYETTRFFIGINYTAPRAFGIYQDENTGNFVVYKNKDDGSRAVRYEGTDEAYAVNELHTRLKQEILQQKGRNINNAKNKSYGRKRKRKSGCLSSFIVLLFVGAPMLFMAWFYHNESPSPIGYYMYNESDFYKGKLFYHYDDTKYGFAVYDPEKGDWDRAGWYPDAIKTKGDCKEYFLGSDYKSSMPGYDFKDSLCYDDFTRGFAVDQGYYSYDDNVYYHMKTDQDSGWYVYDNDDEDWEYIFNSEIPSDLKHQSVANDFWYTPDWSQETQYTDFTETDDYQEYQEDLRKQAEYQASQSSDSGSRSSDYSWDSSSDSWDSGSTDWGSDW